MAFHLQILQSLSLHRVRVVDQVGSYGTCRRAGATEVCSNFLAAASPSCDIDTKSTDIT